MALSSSLLLSPEGPSDAPTGASLIAAAKRGARARMMGVQALARAVEGGNAAAGSLVPGGAFELGAAKRGAGVGRNGCKKDHRPGGLLKTPTRSPTKPRPPTAAAPSTGPEFAGGNSASPTPSPSPARSPRKAAFPRRLSPSGADTQLLIASPSKSRTPAGRPVFAQPPPMDWSQGPRYLASAFDADLRPGPAAAPGWDVASAVETPSASELGPPQLLPADQASTCVTPGLRPRSVRFAGAAAGPSTAVLQPAADVLSSTKAQRTPASARSALKAARGGPEVGFPTPVRPPRRPETPSRVEGLAAPLRFDSDSEDELIVAAPSAGKPASLSAIRSPKAKASRENLRSLLYPDSPSGSPTKRAPASPSARRTRGSGPPSAVDPQGEEGLESLVDEFAGLASLHGALERAVLLHLATEGGGTALGSAFAAALAAPNPSRMERGGRPSTPEPAEEGTRKVNLPGLVSLQALKPVVERGCGKRFGLEELKKLVWIWNDAPPSSPSVEPRCGLGFIITPDVRRRARRGADELPYLLGIQVAVRSNPALPPFELSGSPGAGPAQFPPSPSSNRKRHSGREGMSLVALWSAAGEERKREVGKRLRGVYKNGGRVGRAELPVPGGGTDSERGRKRAMIVPSETDEEDEEGDEGSGEARNRRDREASPLGRRSAKRVRPTIASAEREGSPTPTSARKPHQAPNSAARATPSKRQELLGGASTPDAPSPAGSKRAKPAEGEPTTAGRAMSLAERIKAKEATRLASLTASSSISFLSPSIGKGGVGGQLNAREAAAAARAVELRRRSMLSRLPEVADGVFMMFTSEPAGAPGGATVPMSPARGAGGAGRRRAAPLGEVARTIGKSSKVAMSSVEAEDAVKLLVSLCPDFIGIKRIGGRGDDWVVAQPGLKGGGGQGLAGVKERIREALED